MKIIIGSTSERKITTAKKILEEYFKHDDLVIEGFPAKSQMPDTPYDKQTFDGARNRALNCKTHIKDADYYIGTESGLVERYGHLYEEAWTAVIDAKGSEWYGFSSGLKVPDYILKKMNEYGKDHSSVMTIVEKEIGSTLSETWGSYSGGIILREVSVAESLRAHSNCGT